MTMEWEKLLVPYRLDRQGKTKKITESGRNPFAKDQDRLIFSSAFRRLSKKTQVHPMVENDHIHTRLTHSIEVACVGRTIGNLIGSRLRKEKSVKLPTPHHLGTIVQAACLAHDIGNTPFGHAGESAIQDWFTRNRVKTFVSKEFDKKLTSNQQTDFTAFDGNAMGFRILTTTEYDTYKGGMRLSFPTLATTLKYPWLSPHTLKNGKKKFSCFYSERQIMAKICKKLGIIKIDKYHYARHPLAYIVEAADDICNNLLDIEDATEIGIVSYNEILKICKKYNKDDTEFLRFTKSKMSERRKLSYIRGKTIHRLIYAVVDSFMENYDEIMDGTFDNRPLISVCDKESKDLIKKTQEVCFEKIFNHPKKIEIEIGAYTAIGAMLDACFEAAIEIFDHKLCPDGNLSFKTKRVLSLLGLKLPKDGEVNNNYKNIENFIFAVTGKQKTNDDIELYELILPFMDYLCGMTDNFATHISQQIMGKAANSVRN